MNRIIKHISVLFVFVILMLSCSKDEFKSTTYDLDSFVRFNFLVNSNNIPLEYPAVGTSLIPLSTYTNQSVKTLKVPVTLSSPTLKEAVRVNFSATTSGDSNVFSIEPTNELLFEGNKLTDTISLSFDKRWTDSQDINLKLESVSDADIHIGNLNTVAPNDIFKINLGEISTSYTFPVNKILINGELGEQVDFKVDFPNGFIPSEIENAPIFSFLNGFDYLLTHDDFGDDRSSITYHLKLLEDIQNDDVRYGTKITLNNFQAYEAKGQTSLTIEKPLRIPRDVNSNPAANFYNLSDQYYRTYGAHWFEKNSTCSWVTFFAFTFPVVVDKDNENAIQYSGQGTADTSDDVYYDAFKIGFNVVTGSGTTNSFGLKDWFTNESISAVNSPGFNITSALEFFPEDGNNKSKGIVLVNQQDIIITGNGNSYSIEISGEGTYQDIGNGFFEISFELRLTNDSLFKEDGGTVSSQYRIYNKNGFPTLTPLNEPCYKPKAL